MIYDDCTQEEFSLRVSICALNQKARHFQVEGSNLVTLCKRFKHCRESWESCLICLYDDNNLRLISEISFELSINIEFKFDLGLRITNFSGVRAKRLTLFPSSCNVFKLHPHPYQFLDATEYKTQALEFR